MRKTIFKIGVILLFAFFVIALIADTPQSHSTNYQTIADMQGTSDQNLSYNGQNYTTSYLYFSIQANAGDTIQLTVVENDAEVKATAFFEQSNGSPIFAYQTATNLPATYFMTLGNPNVPFYGVTQLPYNKVGSTTYRVQLGVPQQDTVNATWDDGAAAGGYSIIVNVNSYSLFLTYEATAIIFLIAGVITTILGYFLKPKK